LRWLIQRNVVVVQKSVRPCAPESGEVLTPDYLVLATGSTYPFPAKSGSDDTETAIDRYRASNDELDRAGRGWWSGQARPGLELAGEISGLAPAPAPAD
jgi:hypothetical protein